jgi:hypothetical protein
LFGSILVQHPTRLPKDSDRLTVIIPAHYQGYIRFLLGVWLLVWGVMETVLTANFLVALREHATTSLPSAPALAVLLAAFTAAGAFMVWRLLWVSRGREILELTGDGLRVYREPGARGPEKFARAGITNLHIGSYAGKPIYPSWGRAFIGKEEAFIAFDYDGKSREIARGILRRDAEYILELLRSASTGLTAT